MRNTRVVESLSIVIIGLAFCLDASRTRANAQSNTTQPVRIDSDDIGGLVTSANGPEPGVWVIAETRDLPTKFVKIVVTDDRGRYVLPDLPKANYTVWVRGYGLVDSPKLRSTPGTTVNLSAIIAPTPSAAAQYYPASYWYSLLRVPDKNEFPGTGPNGNGISEKINSQAEWLEFIKTDSCWSCHQLGNKATREIPQPLRDGTLGNFDSPTAAWERRVHSGQAGSAMVGGLARLGRQRALAMFADWTNRIAAGELPPVPPRPRDWSGIS